MDEQLTNKLAEFDELLKDFEKTGIPLVKNFAILSVKYFFKKVIFRKSVDNEVAKYRSNIEAHIKASKDILIKIHEISTLVGVSDKKLTDTLANTQKYIDSNLVKLEVFKTKIERLLK